MIKPLTPNEVEDNIEIPDFVIESVNNLLKQNFRNDSCKLTQKEVVAEIMKNAPEELTRSELFKKHYMDFETIYENAGWYVVYDKPAFNEHWYEPTFTFTRKIKS